MIRRLPFLLSLVLASSAMAQRTTTTTRFGSHTGFGSVLYPGTGGPPQIRLPGMVTDPTFAARFGSTVRGYPSYGAGAGRGGMRGGGYRGGFGGPVVIPVPIVVGGGGYGYGYDAPPPGYYPQQPMPVQMQQQPQAPPVIIINQGYRSEQMNPVVRRYEEGDLPEPAVRRYDAPVNPMPDPAEMEERASRPARRARLQEDKPTIYLIAFKDHTILPALAYWMEGDVLNYITTQGTPNRASITLIDREMSRQLNDERQVEFSLP